VSTRFGLLKYTATTNLGDEIQSIAAERFLPRVDLTIDRDRLDRLPLFNRRSFKLIMNGWFSHLPELWPPHPRIDPLLLSMHITDSVTRLNRNATKPSEVMLRGKGLDYLKAHQPVGARDLWTVALLKQHGIDTYFSGCLTLTLQRPPGVAREDFICVNDVPPAVAEKIARETDARIVATTNIDRVTRGYARRRDQALARLRIFAAAKVVVTTRLHCALPCLAMGTPVLFLRPEESNRFAGLSELVASCTVEDFLRGAYSFDLKAPLANPALHHALRDRLIADCTRFVGDAA